ncbi:MAG: hypothetical protein HY721_00460 [Planctomycetes bacterium]|nr:hypothetical protein [Planctomycetota bacterium]
MKCCRILLFVCAMSGCAATVGPEDFVRLAATWRIGEAKTGFSESSHFVRIGDQSMLFRLCPGERPLGLDRLSDLRTEIAERPEGFLAGYELGTSRRADSTRQGEPTRGQSVSWLEGYSYGQWLARTESARKE